MTDPAPSKMRLAALVVTHNRLDKLRETVARLLAEPLDHLLVVDNLSTDGTRDWLAGQTDPRLDVLLLEDNLGGAGGFELGLRAIQDRFDPDWTVLMDDDARPEPGTFAAFRAEDWSGWTAVAGAAFYPDGRICETNRPWINPFWHARAFLRTLIGGGRMGFHLPDSAYDTETPRKIDGASFVGLFLSRAAIDMAGYPDGRLFIYADDSIYTLELSRAGGRIAFVPGLRFEHDCSTLAPEGPKIYRPLWKIYYIYRNGLILYHRAAGPVWFWCALPVVLLKWTLAGRPYGEDRPQYYRYLMSAIRDALFRRRASLEQQKVKMP
ncbi:glycosyltransferase [Thalassococcus sp. S3]|uniref:glycosyltransferase n=1 Tax=Thalassococcus sp. S3 TaxID=2017482 RepID=UPI0010249113|nr:glycosyltransferase [Thalassococcus sp. S3]QBF34243.1 glycosyltransferase [Thalassococcus sp. S3]